mmetsp:Transcript_27807/g.69104  ORF Transcript_27807/g.69104 Transcript_27807/m.69104 type:complete len:233 (+) Transcript_27807:277-975(+)
MRRANASLLEVALDPSENVIASGDRLLLLRLDHLPLIGLREEGDGVPRAPALLVGRGHPHAVQVGQQPAARPAREHIPNVDGDAALDGVDARPPGAAIRRARVRGAFEPRLPGPLEEQREARPVGVGPRAPQPRRVAGGDGRVVEQAEGALAVGGPQRVGARERAGRELWARAPLEQREQPQRERVRRAHQRVGVTLKRRRLAGPASVHGSLARGDLEALFLVGRAGAGAHL